MFNHIRHVGNMAAYNGVDALIEYDMDASKVFGEKTEPTGVDILECQDSYFMRTRETLVEMSVLAIHHLSRYMNTNFVDELFLTYETTCSVMNAWPDESETIMVRLNAVCDVIRRYMARCKFIDAEMVYQSSATYEKFRTEAKGLVNKLIYFLSYLLNVPVEETTEAPILMQNYAILPGTLDETKFNEWLKSRI